MKRLIYILGFVGTALAVGQTASAEGARVLNASNRLRLEYDDNVFETKDNEQDSFKLIEELDLSLNANAPQTFLGLHYRPSFVYWTDRDPDDTDLNHQLDAVLNHEFTPRLSLNVKDRLRYAELPEGIADDVIVRQNDDFLYNSVNATLSTRLSPETKIDLGGRNIILKYDEDAVSQRQDYMRNVGGVVLNQQLKPTLNLVADARYEEIGYDDAEQRDSSTVFVGAGADQTFSPNLLGSLRAGYQQKDFDSAGTDSTDSPYGDVSLTLLPSPATRLTLGASFSQSETDVFPYANQERTSVYATAAHDLTAKIAGYLSATYASGDYKGEEAIAGSNVGDGTEDTLGLSARTTYAVNRNNILELGYQFTDLSSDFAREFTRNRVNVGWTFLF